MYWRSCLHFGIRLWRWSLQAFGTYKLGPRKKLCSGRDAAANWGLDLGKCTCPCSRQSLHELVVYDSFSMLYHVRFLPCIAVFTTMIHLELSQSKPRVAHRLSRTRPTLTNAGRKRTHVYFEVSDANAQHFLEALGSDGESYPYLGYLATLLEWKSGERNDLRHTYGTGRWDGWTEAREVP
jgi:hypothetical protein